MNTGIRIESPLHTSVRRNAPVSRRLTAPVETMDHIDREAREDLRSIQNAAHDGSLQAEIHGGLDADRVAQLLGLD